MPLQREQEWKAGPYNSGNSNTQITSGDLSEVSLLTFPKYSFSNDLPSLLSARSGVLQSFILSTS